MSMLLSLLLLAASPEGHYRYSAMEVASELVLHPGGRFEYYLTTGALDQQADGLWVREGDTVRLTTDPKPVPPVFAPKGGTLKAGTPLEVLVQSPSGEGLALIDVLVEFAEGEPLQDYTQEYGWTMPAEEKRTPRCVRLGIVMYGVESECFSIDPAKANSVTFTLTPNDLTRVNFDKFTLNIQGDDLAVAEHPDTIYNRVRAGD